MWSSIKRTASDFMRDTKNISSRLKRADTESAEMSFQSKNGHHRFKQKKANGSSTLVLHVRKATIVQAMYGEKRKRARTRTPEPWEIGPRSGKR